MVDEGRYYIHVSAWGWFMRCCDLDSLILLGLHVTISQDFLLMIIACGTGCYLEVPVVGLPSPKGSANSFALDCHQGTPAKA